MKSRLIKCAVLALIFLAALHGTLHADDDSPKPPPISSLPRRPSKASADLKPGHHGDQAPSRPPKTQTADHDHIPGRPPKTSNSPPPPALPPGRPPKKPAHSLSEDHPPGRPVKAVHIPPADYLPNRPAKGALPSPPVDNPPVRPPKAINHAPLSPSSPVSGNNNIAMEDLERRFCFHEPNEFPPPEPMSLEPKRLPSMSRSFRKMDQKENIGYL